MQTQRFEQRLATTGTFTIKKNPNGDHQIEITELFLTADTLSTVAFADGTKTVTFDVGAGSFVEFCMSMVFRGDNDITVTATGGNVTVICDVTYKK